MSFQEWLTICEWMTTRWPDFARVEEPVIRAMHEDLKLYAAKDVHEVIVSLHRGGRESPPKGSTILKSLREHGIGPDHVFDRDHCDHVWAIPTPWELGMDLRDQKVCVQCGKETLYEGARAERQEWLDRQAAKQLRKEEREAVQPDKEGNRGEPESGSDSPF